MMRRVGSALGCGLFGALAGAAAMILLYSLDAGLSWRCRTTARDCFTASTRRARGGVDLRVDGRARRASAGRARSQRRHGRARFAFAARAAIPRRCRSSPIARRRRAADVATGSERVPGHRGHRSRRKAKARGLTLSIASSNTFVPGPGDRAGARRAGGPHHARAGGPRRVPPRRPCSRPRSRPACSGRSSGCWARTATTAVGAATLLAVAPGGGAARRPRSLRAVADDGRSARRRDRPRAAGSGGRDRALAWRARCSNTARFAMMFTGSALLPEAAGPASPDKGWSTRCFTRTASGVMAGNYFFTSIAPAATRSPIPSRCTSRRCRGAHPDRSRAAAAGLSPRPPRRCRRSSSTG